MHKLWFTIFNVVLAVAVFGSIFYYLTLKSGPNDPDFYVRDIALTVNEMSSKKGHIKAFYSLPADYNIEFKNCNIILKTGIGVINKEYPYVCNKDVNIIVKKDKNVLILEKKENV